MQYILQNHSSYPRAAALRETFSAGAELALDERVQIEAAVREQEEMGLDIVTAGGESWTAAAARFMAALDGAGLGGESRFFGTGITFRQPVVNGALRRPGPITLAAFLVARLTATRPVKPVLIGPYTLARLCRIEGGPYAGIAPLANALAEIVAAEVRELVGAGAQLVQIDEPAVLHCPEDIRLLREVNEPLWAVRGSAQLMLATYLADAAPLYAQLNSVPADIVIFDVVSSPGLVELIGAVGASKPLGLGLVDGRGAQLEEPSALAARVEAMLGRYTFDAIHLLPSCGLEALSSQHARAKLGLLPSTRKHLASF